MDPVPVRVVPEKISRVYTGIEPGPLGLQSNISYTLPYFVVSYKNIINFNTVIQTKGETIAETGL